MPYIALVRHGESAWNEKGLWTGLNDVELTEKGRAEARAAGEQLKDVDFHSCHCSVLRRAKDTASEIKVVLKCEDLPTKEHAALNERDYGDLSGKNKWKIKEEHGEEQFMKWRRSWDHPVPGGETLKDVHTRVLPYFEQHIMEDIKKGQNVLVAAHGNSLRALVKHLEKVSDEEIPNVEIATGEVWLYKLDESGAVLSKEVRKAEIEEASVSH